jgi:prolyl-tRNA synthetase
MGGDISHEFMVPAGGGEDSVARCVSCSWATSNITEQLKKNKACPKCKGKLEFQTAIEIGHVFKLGIKYSKTLGAKFLDEDGREKPIIMGCYGIGVNRIMAAAIEQGHDKDGIIWPEGISPYQVLILALNIQDKKSKQQAFKIYQKLRKENIDVLLDERDERAGIKLKDADLIGVPVQIIIGEKNIQEGRLEIKIRKTAKITTTKLEDVLARLPKPPS